MCRDFPDWLGHNPIPDPTAGKGTYDAGGGLCVNEYGVPVSTRFDSLGPDGGDKGVDRDGD